jgi:hypothetical protein
VLQQLLLVIAVLLPLPANSLLLTVLSAFCQRLKRLSFKSAGKLRAVLLQPQLTS